MITALALGASLGCGLVAGVFFGFSTLVMRGLRRLPPAQGISAMQSINVAAINPLFLLALLATAASCAVLVIWSVLRQQQPLLFAGGTVYLVGTIALTAAYHLPRNDTLDAVSPDQPDASRYWAGYLTGWTAWNHVRAIAGLGAALLLALAR
jgi:uncharacterized membrane protein